MSAITAKASRKMKKYAVLTREPRCFLGSFDFSWEQRKLGDIADIVGGGTPSTGNQSYWDGDIDWYAPAEIADQIYANSSQKKITGLGYENSSAKMLPPGTVLFTSRAGIGKTAILTRKGCTNQGFQSIVPHRGELDSYFIFSRTKELKRYGELVGAGSTFVEVSGKQMAVMELMMPPTMREQQTIGGFFQQLDHLITLHQRKCVFLFGFFQAFISMIFTASTFSWEQRKFSDVVATRRGLTYKPSDIRKNGVRVLRSSNIAEDSFVLSDEDVFVVREAVNIDCVRANDILITAANGSSRLVGKHTIISGIPEESAVHGGFMLLGTTKEPHFVNASMGSSWYRRFIELFVAGGNGAIGNLNKNDLDNQDIAIPSEKEQKKIGSFFRQLDNLITLHQRECISFTARAGRRILTANKKRNTSSWEQRKLGEIGSVSMCRRIFKEQTSETGDIPFYKIGTFGADPDAFISRELFEEYKSKYPYPQKGDILISASGSIGRAVEFAGNNEYFQDSNIVWLNHDERLSNPFLKCFYSVVKWAGIEGSTIKRLYNDNILNTVICMPSVPEQKRIGLFFENLDNLITLHQRKPFLMKWRTSDANRNKTNRLVL